MSKKSTKRVARESSREELIQSEYFRLLKSYIIGDDGDSTRMVPYPPEHRHLHVGERVQVGNLQDCSVVFVSHDFRFIVIEYSLTNRDESTTRHFGGWAWHDVFSIKHIQPTNLFGPRSGIFDRLVTTSISQLELDVWSNGIDPNPTYQRGYVWSLEDKLRYIDSVFQGRDLGKFVFLKYEWPRTDIEVLDGKQRLDALMGFMSDQYQYKSYYWSQLSKRDRQQFEDRQVQVAKLDGSMMTEADKLRAFLSVNAAGVPQTEEHIAHIKQKLIDLENS